MLAYLENAYPEEVLKPVEKLRQMLFDEIVSRIDPNEDSVPYLFLVMILLWNLMERVASFSCMRCLS